MHKAVVSGMSHIQFAWDILCRHWRWQACSILLIFACYNPACAGESRKPDKVILQLKWRHQFQFAGYYAAVENGYYKEAGLDVTIVEALPGHDPTEAVLTGKADFGIAGSSLALLRDKGKPVVALAAIFQHSPLVIMMKDDGAIADVHSLTGKKVMMEPLPAEVMAYLQIENIKTDSMTILPHTFDTKDLIEDKVDAMTAYTTTGPYHLRKLKIPYKLFKPRACGIDFYGDCLFTTENQIRLYPERVKAFREASLRGWKYAMDHPEDLITIIRRKYNRKLSREQLQFEAVEMRSLINPNVIEIGYMDRARWQHIVDAYKKAGQISANIPLKDFIYATAPFPFRQKPYYAAIILLALLAAGIGLAAMRFRKLNSILKNEIRLRDHAEEELKATKNILEAAFDQSPAGIIITDAPDGKLRHFNKAARQILGSPENEVVASMGVRQFTPSEQLLYPDGTKIKPEEGPLARAVLHGESCGREFIHEQRIVWAKAAPVVDDRGIIKAGIAIVLDITERKKTQLALQESEKRFQMMADTAPILLWMSGQDGLCTYFNRRWLEFTGRKLEQELGNGWSECVHPEDHQHCLYIYTKAFSVRRPFVIEYRLRHNSGEYRWIMNSGVPRFNADGDFLGYIGTGTDITGRKIVEEELRESEQFLRQAEHISRIGGWKANPETKSLFWTEGIRHILELPADYQPALEEWLNFFAPEYVPLVKETIRKSMKQGSAFIVEAEAITATGKRFWAEIRGASQAGGAESPQIMGTFQDITDHKLTEDFLKGSL
jgi:PAS domain S-box-containing protein